MTNNAHAPLRIETPDGSGQVVHPSVVKVADEVTGSRYWMACTPYPFGDDRHENPIIRISDDGAHWRAVAGAPDPLIPAPADPDAHHADPELLLIDGRFILYFMTTNKRMRHTTFSMMQSDDGVSWSQPEVIYENTWGVSPTVVHRAGDFTMWYIELDTSIGFGPSVLWRRSSPGGPTSFGPPERCTIDIDHHVPWHLEVRWVGDGLEALVAAFPADKDTSHTRLFHVTSSDGLRFASAQPVLTPSLVGWDSRMIYRSSFITDGEGNYTVWYTGGSWNRHFGIGLVAGPLHDLTPVAPLPTLRDRLRWLSDAGVGYGKYRIKPLVPESVRALVRKVR